ncbi:MAG: adenosylcobinamide-GDP ribazoletransferase [Gammaproteobacteria bacterium]|nr:adenosylcobinamide-GDP ribazoletransferase [Gammaproteobacteria bacterium]
MSDQVSRLGTFFAAVTFFTRIPRPKWPRFQPSDETHAAAFAPYIGWIVGLFAGAVYIVSAAFLPVSLSVLATLIAISWLTGALHEDGLSDFVDGWLGGQTRERTLAIMHDPRIGVFGGLALILGVAVKFAALFELAGLLSPLTLTAIIVAAHATSRLVAISFMWTHHYVRSDETSAKGRRLSRPMPLGWLALACVGAAIPFAATAVTAPALLLVGLGLLVFRFVFANALTNRLGGYTGDCLGAAQQMAEILFYVGAVACFMPPGS